MICRSEDFKKVSSILLAAIDSNDILASDILEIEVINEILYLSMTNGEYYIKVKLPIYEDIEFHATINASVFLKLITKITTEIIEFNIEDNNLIVTGNGKYKLPMIYDGDSLLSIVKIKIENKTNNFTISGKVLNSIYVYNSKQFAMGNIVNPIQSLYYVDEEGAITFTTGATVNKFNLPVPVKLLLTSKIVKLFKLFKDEDVNFCIGQDMTSSEIIQTKIELISDNIDLIAILPMNDFEVQKVPVKAIRDRAYKNYDNIAVLNKNELLQAINRLLIFSTSSSSIDKTFGVFEFSDDEVIIRDSNKINSEKVKYSNAIGLSDNYIGILDFNDIKLVLETTNDEFINVGFGDHQAIVCSRFGSSIINVIPEIVQ